MKNSANLPIRTCVFSADDSEFPLDILDVECDRWVTSSQVGEALGISNIRALVADLTEKGELIERKHFRRVNLQNSEKGNSRGNPNILALSYRGVIRVCMRSDGKRAIHFRDWAEDVLFEVMTTGGYSMPGGPKQFPDISKAAKFSVALAKTFTAQKAMALQLGLKGNAAILGAHASTLEATGVDVLKYMGMDEERFKTPSKESIQSGLASDFFSALDALPEKTKSSLVAVKDGQALVRLSAALLELRSKGLSFQKLDLHSALKQHPSFIRSNFTSRILVDRTKSGARTREMCKVWVFNADALPSMTS